MNGALIRRADHTDEAIATRLTLDDSQTGPLRVWLDSIDVLTTVDGTGHPDDVAERMVVAVAEHLPSSARAGSLAPGLADVASMYPASLSPTLALRSGELVMILNEVCDVTVSTADRVTPA